MKGFNYAMREIHYDKSAKISFILLISIILIYACGFFYFKNHFFFRTSIDGIDISCNTVEEAKDKIYKGVEDFRLEICGRDDVKDVILSEDINLQYEGGKKIDDIKKAQKPFFWASALIDKKEYNEIKLFLYDESMLEEKINKMNMFNNSDLIEPQNPQFQYTDGTYMILKEIEGNKIDRDKLLKTIKAAIETGIQEIDLEKTECYDRPEFTINSPEVKAAKDIMDKYVSSKIEYSFDEQIETVDGSIINKWIKVSNDMKPYINESDVKEYIDSLARKYNTVGRERIFKSSTGKTAIVKGGYYGWKINSRGEVKCLIDNIEHGQSIMKEPLYTQKALARGDDDIGDTYVEVNITRQHVWYYKEGKLIAQGDVVTGCQRKNTPTYLGVYSLNYKQKDATLKGAGYSSDVSYWMPFNGNIGLHDASWRSSFGGNIYKINGTHGCVNMPKYLAKKIFENIDTGTPIICYSEETKSSEK